MHDDDDDHEALKPAGNSRSCALAMLNVHLKAYPAPLRHPLINSTFSPNEFRFYSSSTTNTNHHPPKMKVAPTGH